MASCNRISLLITFLVWLVYLAGGITSRAIINLQFKRMDGKRNPVRVRRNGFYGPYALKVSRDSVWAAVTTFLETDGLFVLPSGVLFYTIPKRALSTDDITSLRELLAEKLPPRRL